MHLLLRPIFCQSHPNFINVCTAYTSEIWAQLTKIFSQNQVQKDSERTLISTAFLFAVNLLAEVVSI